MLELINILLDFSQSIGYWGIVLLMTIESSFVPFPSEIVIPPAAYLASQGEFNIYLVILAGIIGSLLGAIINYYLALTLGRKVIYGLARKNFFKFLLIDEKKIAKSEEYFLKYGNISTFFGRFVPALRQLISIPAGLAKMKLKNFIFYTTLGSGLWVIILAILGYAFGANQELLASYYKEISIFFVAVAVVVIIGLIIRNKSKSNQHDLSS